MLLTGTVLSFLRAMVKVTLSPELIRALSTMADTESLASPAVHGDFFAFYRFVMAAAAGGKGCLGCTRHGFGGLNGFGNRPAGARFERNPGSYAVRHGRIGDAKAGNVGGARIFQAICQLYRIAGVDGGFADGAGKGQRDLFLLTRYLERNTFGNRCGYRRTNPPPHRY